jgi:hypothetical protein
MTGILAKTAPTKLRKYLALMHTFTDIKCHEKKVKDCPNCVHFLSGWYFRNLVGAVLASIPVIAVYSNMSCELVDIREKIINETTVSSRAWYLGEEMVFWDCKSS